MGRRAIWRVWYGRRLGIPSFSKTSVVFKAPQILRLSPRLTESRLSARRTLCRPPRSPRDNRIESPTCRRLAFRAPMAVEQILAPT
jgi:hypothetical protein